MVARTNLQVIDADAHVIETDRTWDYLEPSEQRFRPVLTPASYDPTRLLWAIEGQTGGLRQPDLSQEQIRGMAQQAGRKMETPQASRELDDVNLRLKHMDELGIDIQVLHNTMWIEEVTQRPDVEAALCRAWNRWLADVWRMSRGRLRWSCVIPTLMLDEALIQMRAAKENGAVAIWMRPLEGDRSMADPYFYPIYEEASRLDMAIVVHAANANSAICALFRSFPGSRLGNAFAIFRNPIAFACLGLMTGEILQVFPKLRWGFIEASSQWIPWVWHEAAGCMHLEGKELPEDPFHEYNIFVSCETHDDLPWILKYASDQRLVIGTDYGHQDMASVVDAITLFQQRTDIGQETKDRILHYNPKAFYNL